MNIQPEIHIIPHLHDKRDAETVLKYVKTYNQRLGTEGGAYHLLDPLTHKLRRLRGLTTVLKELYWPQYKPWSRTDATPLKRALHVAAESQKKRRRLIMAVKPQAHEPMPMTVTDAAKGFFFLVIAHEIMLKP